MWKIQQNLALLMENPFPTCLRAYCQTFGISFFDLRLLCIFCKKYLTVVDLAQFYKKELCLVWRNHVAFGCCYKCICLSARYESDNHFVCAVKVQNLHDFLNCSLENIHIRCYYCLSVLTLSEKVDLITRGKSACLVRGYWRAPCSECINRDI